MSNRILVTYATRAGSTKGVAEAVAKILAEDGAQVEVRPMSDVTDLTPYTAVVAGSAIQAAAWLPEAMRFIQANRDALNQKPFAAFQVCMTAAMKNEEWRAHAGEWLNPVRAQVPPVSDAVFAGALDISKVPSFMERLKFRISVLLGVWPAGDSRDWDAIHAWARGLKPLLGA